MFGHPEVSLFPRFRKLWVFLVWGRMIFGFCDVVGYDRGRGPEGSVRRVLEVWMESLRRMVLLIFYFRFAGW